MSTRPGPVQYGPYGDPTGSTTKLPSLDDYDGVTDDEEPK